MTGTEVDQQAVVDTPADAARTDGQAGQPFSAPANTPGAPNAALKEPAPPKGDGYVMDHPAAARLVVLDRDRGIVGTADRSPMRKRLAICGFASSTRHYIAHVTDDPEWEIWGVNQFYRHLPAGQQQQGGRADRWFDIHWNWDKEIVPGTDHRQFAQQCGIPFYMLRTEPDIPTAARYPIDALVEHFKADYFTSTISYMVALAIYEIDKRVESDMAALVRQHATDFAAGRLMDLTATLRGLYAEYTLGIFGVDLTVGGEYFHEKPCAEFWLGQAVGRGIDVRVPRESALCKHAVRYGYEKEPGSVLKLDEIETHQVKLRAERDDMFKRLMMVEGALECDEMWRQTVELRLRGTQINGR